MTDNSTDDGGAGVTRRGFVSAAAVGATAAGAASGGVSAATAAGTDLGRAQAQSYRFGGEVQAWRGRAPSAIEGEQNPTLELEAGQRYEVVWENLDGQPHDFTIQNDGGTNLAATDLVQQQGETASLTFTATPEMTQYICTVHPTTMVGDVEVTGEYEGGSQGGAVPLWPMLLLGGVAMMFLSPLVFALFLFSRSRDRGESAGR